MNTILGFPVIEDNILPNDVNLKLDDLGGYIVPTEIGLQLLYFFEHQQCPLMRKNKHGIKALFARLRGIGGYKWVDTPEFMVWKKERITSERHDNND